MCSLFSGIREIGWDRMRSCRSVRQVVLAELEAVEVFVSALPGHEFLVRALLGDPSILNDGDGIGPLDG